MESLARPGVAAPMTASPPQPIRARWTPVRAFAVTQGRMSSGLAPGASPAVGDAVQTVFLVGAGIAALGLIVVLALREVPLHGPGR
jgi:hypothetical protein